MSDGTPGDGVGDVTPLEVRLRVCQIIGWSLRNYDYLESHCRGGTAHPDVVAGWRVAVERARRDVIGSRL